MKKRNRISEKYPLDNYVLEIEYNDYIKNSWSRHD